MTVDAYMSRSLAKSVLKILKSKDQSALFDDKILKYSKNGVNRFDQWKVHISIYIYLYRRRKYLKY